MSSPGITKQNCDNVTKVISPVSSAPAIVSRVVLQVSLLGVRLGPAPALGSERFLQPPVLVHLGLQVLLRHPRQDVGQEGGEEVWVNLRILVVESVEMSAQRGHHLGMDLHTATSE